MPDTFAQQMLTKIEALLLANPGVQSITIDGESVSYVDLMKQYDSWASRVARETGTKPRVFQIDLGGF